MSFVDTDLFIFLNADTNRFILLNFLWWFEHTIFCTTPYNYSILTFTHWYNSDMVHAILVVSLEIIKLNLHDLNVISLSRIIMFI